MRHALRFRLDGRPVFEKPAPVSIFLAYSSRWCRFRHQPTSEGQPPCPRSRRRPPLPPRSLWRPLAQTSHRQQHPLSPRLRRQPPPRNPPPRWMARPAGVGKPQDAPAPHRNGSPGCRTNASRSASAENSCAPRDRKHDGPGARKHGSSGWPNDAQGARNVGRSANSDGQSDGRPAGPNAEPVDRSKPHRPRRNGRMPVPQRTRPRDRWHNRRGRHAPGNDGEDGAHPGHRHSDHRERPSDDG